MLQAECESKSTNVCTTVTTVNNANHTEAPLIHPNGLNGTTHRLRPNRSLQPDVARSCGEAPSRHLHRAHCKREG